MQFDPPLVRGTLLRRYKRFLADIKLEDGGEITASVPNTGSMRGLTESGFPVWLSVSDSPTRKYRHTLQIVEADDTMVGINTSLPNSLAEEAITSGLIADLGKYPILKREQKYGQNSRIDILLESETGQRTYVEVKNVHFRRETGLAEFPDSVTTRGAKHLRELSDMVAQGHRAVMVYLVQRSDVDRFSICDDLDPEYAAAYRLARAAGVEAHAVYCDVSQHGITPSGLLAMDESRFSS